MMRLSTAQLWVHDQDEALDFWTKKVGMELRAGVTLPEMGDFRWLTVGPPGQEEVAIVLMAIPGPPVFEPAAAQAGRAPADLRAGDVRGRERARREGLRRHGVPRDRRLPRLVRGAHGARRRV